MISFILGAVLLQTPTEEAKASFEISDLLGLLVVLVLVLLTGFFVAAEFALVSMRDTRITQLVELGNSAAKAVQKARQHLDEYIAGVQLGVTLASLSLGVIGEPALEHLIEPTFVSLLGGIGMGVASAVSLAIAFLIITTLEIILGELVPKSAALQRTEGTALFVIRPLNLFLTVFRPFIWVLNWLGGLVLRMFGLNASLEHTQVHSAEELELLVKQSHEAGILDKQEESLLRQVFDFNDKTIRQIMVPRTEIVGITENISLDELVEKAATEQFTRFPVYHESLDHIIAVIHIKDLIPLLQAELARLRGQISNPSITNQQVSLKSIMRPVFNLPETVHVADLLAYMRLKQAHLAVVIDEYGGTSGIVTLEDVLEELVGEVQDEFDAEESAADNVLDLELRPDGSALVSGLLEPDVVEESISLVIPPELREGYDTIGGCVLSALGRIPSVGESVKIGQYRLTVVEMDGLRIDRILIEPLNNKKAQIEKEAQFNDGVSG